MTFEEQLEKLGPEFVMVMNKEKEVTYEKIYNFLINANDIDGTYKDLTADEKLMLFNLFKDFYSFGFYKGVEFILDPDNLHPETIEQIYKK